MLKLDNGYIDVQCTVLSFFEIFQNKKLFKKTLKVSYISLPSIPNPFQKTCINIKTTTNTFTHYKDVPKESKILKPTLIRLILDIINKNVQ